VEDFGSLNGTFIDEVRIDNIAIWQVGQILRCGRTTFRLIQESAAVTRERPRDSHALEAPLSSQQVPEKPIAEEQIAVVRRKPVESPEPEPSRLADHNKPSYTAGNVDSSGSGSAVAGIVFGLLLLIAGLYGWQHYQPQIDMINSMLGQFAIGVGGDSVSSQAEMIRMYYIGSIASACLGAVMILGCGIALAVRKR
jgi:hypothetical protein